MDRELHLRAVSGGSLEAMRREVRLGLPDRVLAA
jgi:hypothetical protein